jgi:hypothetical protein
MYRHVVLTRDSLYRKLSTMSEIPGSQPDEPDHDPPTPRWVKAFALVALAVGALIVVLLATGHRPGRHTRAAQDGTAPPSSITTHGSHQP